MDLLLVLFTPFNGTYKEEIKKQITIKQHYHLIEQYLLNKYADYLDLYFSLLNRSKYEKRMWVKFVLESTETTKDLEHKKRTIK